MWAFWFPNSWKSVVWLICAIMPLYFYQTLIHEGAHGFGALFVTGEFPTVAPFPHFNAGSGFLHGAAFTHGHGFVALPQIVALTLIIGLSFIFVFWPMRSLFVRYGLRTWYLGLCVDLLFNTSGGLAGVSRPGSDWGKLQANYVGTAGIIVLSWFIWIIVVGGHLAWVRFSAWHRHMPKDVSFWDYRWVALALMLLSVSAILFSALVDHPDIAKGGVHSGYFIVFLVLQCLWLAANATLFFASLIPLVRGLRTK